MNSLVLSLSGMALGLVTGAAAGYAQHQELIGAPVYAADGVEVGRVADVSSTGKQIDALRVSKGAPLGFGERFIIIPQPAFMIRRGSIVLPDLRAEDVDRFPDASTMGNGETDNR